jgi:hypothetical protein
MTERQQRAQRAQELLDDEVLKAALVEMESRAVEEFIAASRWWWGDRRRRIAAEHVREVRDFKARLEAVILNAPIQRMRSVF